MQFAVWHWMGGQAMEKAHMATPCIQKNDDNGSITYQFHGDLNVLLESYDLMLTERDGKKFLWIDDKRGKFRQR